MKSYKSGHKENTTSRIKLDELGVQDIDACIVDFNCDPFDPENVQLRSLQSGQLVSKEGEDDLLSAYEDGETKVKEFFKERIFTRIKEWWISKCNRKTFLNDNNKKVSVAKCKAAQMENDAMSRVISEYCGTDVTLIDILENRVTDECLAVFNTNGTMVKTQKSKLLQSFVFAPLDFTDLQNYTAVVDMVFSGDYVCPPLKIERKGTERSTHGQIMLIRYFFTIMNRHLNAKTVIFVNDPYDVIDSVKTEEHVRRNCIYESKNVYIKPIDELPNKTNLSTFFSNKSNKIRLQNYLKVEFQKLSQSFPGKELIYSIQRNCEELKTGINIPYYECYHQEVDTILFYIIHALRQTCNHNIIIIDAKDMDVIVLSSLVSHIESGVLGIRRKKSSFYCDKFLVSTVINF